jgi:hypothetical protein
VSDSEKEPVWPPGLEPDDEPAEPELRLLQPVRKLEPDAGKRAFLGLILDWNRLPAELPLIHQPLPVPMWVAGQGWLSLPLVDE